MLFCFVFWKGEENLFLGNDSSACFFSDWKGIFYKACNAEVINWGEGGGVGGGTNTKKTMKTWICTLENWWAENGRKETIQVWVTQLKQGKALLDTVEPIKPDFLWIHTAWLGSPVYKAGTLLKAFPAFEKLSTSCCLVNSQLSDKKWVHRATASLDILIALLNFIKFLRT